MTTVEPCPFCRLIHSPQWPCPTPNPLWVTFHDSLHPTPTPTQQSILRAQLADLKRTIADYRKMLDMQAEIIARLSEIEKRMKE